MCEKCTNIKAAQNNRTTLSDPFDCTGGEIEKEMYDRQNKVDENVGEKDDKEDRKGEEDKMKKTQKVKKM